MQLELGVPLRWPGRWRQRLVDACTASLPAFLTKPTARPPSRRWRALRTRAAAARTLEIAAERACGLVTVDTTADDSCSFLPTMAWCSSRASVRAARSRVGSAVCGSRPTRWVRCTSASRVPCSAFPTRRRSSIWSAVSRALSSSSTPTWRSISHRTMGTEPAGRSSGGPRSRHARRSHDGAGRTRLRIGRRRSRPVAPRARRPRPRGRPAALAAASTAPRRSRPGFSARAASTSPSCMPRRGSGRRRPAGGLRARRRARRRTASRLQPRPVHRLPVVRGGGPVPVRLVYASCRLPGSTARPAVRDRRRLTARAALVQACDGRAPTRANNSPSAWYLWGFTGHPHLLVSIPS